MWFIIITEDKPDTLSERQQARPQHLARLTALQKDARLLLAGPCPAIAEADPGLAGYTGSVIIAEFDSLAQAQQWADDDPYWHAGVYQSALVKPFNPVLPK